MDAAWDEQWIEDVVDQRKRIEDDDDGIDLDDLIGEPTAPDDEIDEETLADVMRDL